MMRNVFVALACITATAQACAEVEVPVGALSAVSAYSRAVVNADCPAVEPLSGIVFRHPEAKESLCQAYTAWKQAGLVERLRAPSASLSSGDDRLIVVPNSRLSLDQGRPTLTNGVYVVYSKDGGRDWKVIDIGCDHLKDWVKAVYPAYRGRPAFETTVDHPAASR